MDFSVLVTLGPSILEPEKLKRISSYGRCIFRINGAHEDAESMIGLTERVRAVLPTAELLVDLPGNKIRTKNLTTPIRLVRGENFRLLPSQINFSEFWSYLKKGDEVLANDSTYRLEVLSVDAEAIVLRSHSDGMLGNNKGLHVRGIHKDIPFLFEKDQSLLRRAVELKLDFVSLSFVRTAEDIQESKKLLVSAGGVTPKIIAKIETESSVKNLGPILQEVDLLNVDRGDLSSDIGLLNLPVTQERIIQSVLRAGKRIYLATQFLKNMENNPVPLIAELTSLHEVMKSGIHGIQLSEETAIGRYPCECVKLVFDIFHASFSA